MVLSDRKQTMSLGFLGIIFSILLSPRVFADSGVTYHGRLLKPNGEPVMSPSVQFRIQIRTPSDSDCLMFEEIQTKDLSSSKGLFTVNIGDGSATVANTEPFSLADVFRNDRALTFPAGKCTHSHVTLLSVTASRQLKVFFNDGSFADWEPLPTQQINFVPMAMESVSVAGHGANHLFRVHDLDGAPQNLQAWTPGNYQKFLDLIANTTISGGNASIGGNAAGFTGSLAGDVTGTQSLTKVEKIQGNAVLAGIPSDKQVLTWNHAQLRWEPANVPVAGNPDWNDITGKPTSLPPNGAAGGDLLGSTYPNPTIANGVVSGAKIADGAVSGAKIADQGVGFSKLANGSATGQVLQYDTSLGWKADKLLYTDLVKAGGGSPWPSTPCVAGEAIIWQSATDGFECAPISITETDPSVKAYAKNDPSSDFSTPAGVLTLNTVPITRGGTGAVSQSGAINNLLPSQSGNSGKLLQTNGTNVSWVDAPAGGVTSINGATGASQTFNVAQGETAPVFKTSGSVHTLNIPDASTSGVTAGTISHSDYQTFSGKQSALGFTPLNPANNLSEIASATTARTNLGLGTAAMKNFGLSSGNLVELDGTGKIPASLLPIQSGDGFTQGGNAFGAPAVLGTTDAQPLYLQTGGTDKVTISTDGDVGIGTVTPVSRLTVDGVLTLAQQAGDAVGAVGYGSLFTKSNGRLYYRDGVGTVIDLLDSNAQGGSIKSGWPEVLICWEGTNLRYLYLMVGDGATSLVYYRSRSSSFASNYEIRFNLSNQTYSGHENMGGSACLSKPISTLISEGRAVFFGNSIRAVASDSDNDTKIMVEKSPDENKIRFDTAGVERVIIDETGNVGIGTTAPQDKLDVAGRIRATHLCAADGTNCRDLTTAWAGGGVASVSGTAPISVTGSSTPVVSLNASGVTNTHLADDAVTSAKILDGTITALDLNFTGLNSATSSFVLKDSTGKFANFVCATTGHVPTWTVTGFVCQAPSMTETDPKIGTNTTNMLSKWDGTRMISSAIHESGGNVGIGTTTPGSMLTVAGVIESTAGGVKFPDGETQTKAVTLGDHLCPTGQYLRGWDGAGTKVCVPISVGDVNQTYIQISMGYVNTCAIRSDYLTQCWGDNTYGGLGDGSTTNSSVPKRVRRFDGTYFKARKVLVSVHTVCAIQESDGRVYCWGWGTNGQIGNGASTSRTMATPVSNLGAVKDITSSYLSFCAVDVSDRVWCWGANNYYGLGNGTTTASLVPVPTLDQDGNQLTGVNRVAGATGSAACAYNDAVGSPQIYCWGYNGSGEMGDGTTGGYVQRAKLISMTAMEADGVDQIVSVVGAGDYKNWRNSFCAVGRTAASTYKAYCWGYGAYGNLMIAGDQTAKNTPTEATLIGARSSVFSLTMNPYTSCMLSGTTIQCAGYGGRGDLGNGGTANSYPFVTVLPFGGGAGAFSASRLPDSAGGYDGLSHFCVLSTEGTVGCWGYGAYGQLGNNATANSAYPVGVYQE